MTDGLKHLGFGPISGAGGDPVSALQSASDHSEYISRVLRRRPELLEKLIRGPDVVLAEALADIEAAGGMIGPFDVPMRAMRIAKETAHLAIASGDLSAMWSLNGVVERLTRLADVSTKAALRLAVRAAWTSGSLGETR